VLLAPPVDASAWLSEGPPENRRETRQAALDRARTITFRSEPDKLSIRLGHPPSKAVDRGPFGGRSACGRDSNSGRSSWNAKA
jgi:hypothetical protein